MLEEFKFRGVCYLEKVCNFGLLSGHVLLLELLKNNGYIYDIKRQIAIEHIPCEFNIVGDGFILFGNFGSIYGEFKNSRYSLLDNKLIFYINDNSYHLIFKDKENFEKVKGLLKECAV